jgi:hypothetical protein
MGRYTEMKIMVLNHTNIDGNHFGCQKVEDNIRLWLKRLGATQTTFVPTGTKNYSAELHATASSVDLILINGEGTFHSGREKAELCLRFASKFALRGVPVWFINALYQNNPAAWRKYLITFQKVIARDSFSQKALCEILGDNVQYSGDLSLSVDYKLGASSASNTVMVSDSVSRSKSADLLKFAFSIRTKAPVQYVPLLSSSSWLSEADIWSRARRLLKFGAASSEIEQWQGLTFLNNYQDFLQVCEKSCLHVTGRFHSVCFSLITRTPFVSLSSNSWKINALICDVGLNPQRIISKRSLSEKLILQDWSFSLQESKNINKFLTSTQNYWAQVFESEQQKLKLSYGG